MREIKIGLSNQQRGAVLIVALIMLLLLTLVGIAGIRDTQLQDKMAGGTEDRALAFQAAESALREAEKLITTGNCTGACDPAVGYYGVAVAPDVQPSVASPSRDDNGASAGGNPVSEADFWANHFSADGTSANYWTDNTKSKVYAATALPNVLSQPRYVIELLPADYSTLPNTKNAIPGGGIGTSRVKDFLITARGTGRTDTAVVILQSVYRYSSPVQIVP